MKKYAILLDSTYCTGCNTCAYRCIQEFRYHDQAAKGLFRTFVSTNDGGLYHKRCMHCVDPECVKNCPVEALTKSEYGPVLYNANTCIGCKTCVDVCPFGIPQFDETSQKILKCSLCAHRIGDGTPPACVEACPTGALQFGEYAAVVAKAKALVQKHRLHLYGLEQAGGTHVIVVAKEPPVAAGYPNLPLKQGKGNQTSVQDGMDLPILAGLALGGFKKWSERKALVQAKEKGER
jgi:formate dehydrogenase iron-sulfur subunit